MGHPRAGTHYPKSVGEFQAWFRTDADCLDYLEWLRWPAGFACSGCGRDTGWRLGDGRYMCSKCGSRTSVTAGTIFDRTRTPLTVWFTACWLFGHRQGRDLGAELEADAGDRFLPDRVGYAASAAVGAGTPGAGPAGRAGGSGRDGSSAVRSRGCAAAGPGARRCSPASRWRSGTDGARPVADAAVGRCVGRLAARVRDDHVEPGARVITDGWQGYQGLEKLGYVHQRRSQRAARTRGEDPGELLPAVHRIASLIKRWLLGTHQGSVDTAHLTSYLNEFVFRFNRRRSRSRGMVFYRVLELAVAHDPVRYRDLIVDPTPKMKPPAPPRTRGHPASLERPPANRPWRVASPASASSC